jgi:hypothetical protein
MTEYEMGDLNIEQETDNIPEVKTWDDLQLDSTILRSIY